MVKVTRAHRALASAALTKIDLHIGQERLLMQLWEEDGLTQTQLAERLCIEPPTLTKMLKPSGENKLTRKKERY